LADRVRTLSSAGCFSPIIKGNGAGADAYAVSDTHIPVHCDVGSVDAKLIGFGGAPDFVSIMFTCSLSIGLKIRVNWQEIHQFYSGKRKY
jgi:hypothetical protein